MILGLSILCVSVHIPTLLLRYIPFKDKIDKKKKKLLLFCYGLGLFTDFMLCIRRAGTVGLSIGFYKMNLMIFCVVMAAVNIVIIRGYIREQLFTFGLTALIVMVTLAVAAYIVDLAGYGEVHQALIRESILGLLLYFLFYPWYRKLMIDTVTPFLNLQGHNYWNTVWFLPIAMFLGSTFAIEVGDHISTFLQMASKLMIGAATFLMCENVAKDYKRIEEQAEMSAQIEHQKGYYRALTEAVQNERVSRHNFKHQLEAMRGFLESGNSKELWEYCDRTEEKLKGLTEIPYTGNSAAGGLLYHYACLSKEKNISFSVCGKLSGHSVSDTDLCCVLGNALDNAITACEAYDGERYIKIRIEEKDKMLLLTVDNSFDGILLRDGEKIFSRKRKQEEGIGIWSMRQICDKYGGTCKFLAKGNEFEASFLMLA